MRRFPWVFTGAAALLGAPASACPRPDNQYHVSTIWPQVGERNVPPDAVLVAFGGPNDGGESCLPVEVFVSLGDRDVPGYLIQRGPTDEALFQPERALRPGETYTALFELDSSGDRRPGTQGAQQIRTRFTVGRTPTAQPEAPMLSSPEVQATMDSAGATAFIQAAAFVLPAAADAHHGMRVWFTVTASPDDAWPRSGDNFLDSRPDERLGDDNSPIGVKLQTQMALPPNWDGQACLVPQIKNALGMQTMGPPVCLPVAPFKPDAFVPPQKPDWGTKPEPDWGTKPEPDLGRRPHDPDPAPAPELDAYLWSDAEIDPAAGQVGASAHTERTIKGGRSCAATPGLLAGGPAPWVTGALWALFALGQAGRRRTRL